MVDFGLFWSPVPHFSGCCSWNLKAAACARAAPWEMPEKILGSCTNRCFFLVEIWVNMKINDDYIISIINVGWPNFAIKQSLNNTMSICTRHAPNILSHTVWSQATHDSLEAHAPTPDAMGCHGMTWSNGHHLAPSEARHALQQLIIEPLPFRIPQSVLGSLWWSNRCGAGIHKQYLNHPVVETRSLHCQGTNFTFK